MRVAIIGYGYWGINIAKTISKLKDQGVGFEIETIFDQDNSRVQEAQKLYSFTPYESFDQILDNERIEALFIITPPQTHYALAKKGLQSRKHIFVEKPLTTNSREAYELYELAEKNEVILHCDHVFLHSPAVRYLKENMSSFGDIVYINSRRINLGLFQSSVDVIWDLAIHDLSIIDALIKLEIKKVNTFSRKYQSYPNDALANINIELKNGVIITINVSWLSPVKVREMIIGGTQKSVVYDDTKRDKIKIYDSGVIVKDELDKNSLYAKMVEYKLGEEYTPKLPSYLSLDKSIECFYKCILQNTQEDREHTLRVIEALEVISKI
ncbi:Gfo/Idh/MocA family protein [Helicobacter cholecystus]|uniref:Gfo/Idh/MocA family protein n=1 Tax=Helicobacter cholecystus TaxID=45498 RepID=UPI000F6DF6EB|nr:Gfo/Idh/MocA family oxidoreductase [Helicobacter cholecystus]VEJ24903.1 GFO/IDH/MocA family oxidoreductase [Helicobacter cholecystus]